MTKSVGLSVSLTLTTLEVLLSKKSTIQFRWIIAGWWWWWWAWWQKQQRRLGTRKAPMSCVNCSQLQWYVLSESCDTAVASSEWKGTICLLMGIKCGAASRKEFLSDHCIQDRDRAIEDICLDECSEWLCLCLGYSRSNVWRLAMTKIRLRYDVKICEEI